jgi:hypothetical protein
VDRDCEFGSGFQGEVDWKKVFNCFFTALSPARAGSVVHTSYWRKVILEVMPAIYTINGMLT